MEASAADNTISDTKEPAKVVLTFLCWSIQLSIHHFLHPFILFPLAAWNFIFSQQPSILLTILLFIFLLFHFWHVLDPQSHKFIMFYIYSWVCFGINFYFTYVQWLCYFCFCPYAFVVHVCVRLIVPVCTLRMYVWCVSEYRQPKLKSKKQLSSKKFPKQPNLDLSPLQPVALLTNSQSRMRWRKQQQW